MLVAPKSEKLEAQNFSDSPGSSNAGTPHRENPYVDIHEYLDYMGVSLARGDISKLAEVIIVFSWDKPLMSRQIMYAPQGEPALMFWK